MTMTPPRYHILIVDDDDVICDGLVSYLENYHEGPYTLSVDAVHTGQEARDMIGTRHYDLVISDITLPGEDGFTLLKHIRDLSPKTQTALITAYRIEHYIRNAKKYGIFNIIVKTVPFDFKEFSLAINRILQPQSAFGLENYLAPGSELVHLVIRSSEDLIHSFGDFQTFFADNRVAVPNDMFTAVIEALTNAVYHVSKLPDGSLKYEKGSLIEKLEEPEYVYVAYGRDEEKIALSITDQGGQITGDEILYWLDRNISGANLLDTHGRGMYLIHRLVDRVIINIHEGHQTQLILLDYLGNKSNTNRPLYINQISG